MVLTLQEEYDQPGEASFSEGDSNSEASGIMTIDSHGKIFILLL